jgi:hypothetical protein
MAPPCAPLTPAERPRVRLLVRHNFAKLRHEAGASAKLSSYVWRTNHVGLGHLVASVNAALYFDGGKWARRLAAVLSREDAEDIADAFVALVVEHRLTGAAELALALRACMQGAAFDASLLRALAGKPRPDDARLDRLDAPARLNLITALQLARDTPREEESSAGLDAAWARVRARHAEREQAEVTEVEP